MLQSLIVFCVYTMCTENLACIKIKEKWGSKYQFIKVICKNVTAFPEALLNEALTIGKSPLKLLLLQNPVIVPTYWWLHFLKDLTSPVPPQKKRKKKITHPVPAFPALAKLLAWQEPTDWSVIEHACHSGSDLLSQESKPTPNDRALPPALSPFPAEQLAAFLAATATLPSACWLGNGAAPRATLQPHRGIFFSGCIAACLFTIQFNKFCNKKSYAVLICQWNQIIFLGILQSFNIHSLHGRSRWIKSLQQLQLIKCQSSSPHAFSSDMRFLCKWHRKANYCISEKFLVSYMYSCKAMQSFLPRNAAELGLYPSHWEESWKSYSPAFLVLIWQLCAWVHAPGPQTAEEVVVQSSPFSPVV